MVAQLGNAMKRAAEATQTYRTELGGEEIPGKF
jgi:hypothetical protein